MSAGAGHLPAIVMAGGKDASTFAAAGENPRRGMADIGGRPMVSYVIDALRGSPEVGCVVLVSGPEYPTLSGVDRVVEARGDMVANIAAGLEACRGEGDAALLTSADAPFLTPAAVSDFAARCAAAQPALGYAVIPRAESKAQFPEMHRTYARLKEGHFTGGNLFYLRQSFWPAVERVLTRAYEARKKPWLLAHLLGPRILLRLATRTLTIAEAEAKISGLLGGPCRAVITPYAGIGADVDDPADLAIARRMLGSR